MAMEVAHRIPVDKDQALPPLTKRSSDSRLSLSSPEMLGANSDDLPYSTLLTNVESQRIMSVIQELQKRVQILHSLPESGDRRVSAVLSPESMRYIKAYWEAETHLMALLTDASNHSMQTPDLKNGIKQLKHATRDLSRYFAVAKADVNKLKYLKQSKTHFMSTCEELLNEIKLLMYDRLKTTVDEENLKQEQLSMLISKEMRISNEVKVLRDELDKAKKERNTEINRKNESIRKLKDELIEIRRQAEESTKKLEAKSKQREGTDTEQFREKEAFLLSEINASKIQLSEIIQRNRDEEAVLRKKKFKIEAEVENWISKYDQDMEEKQAEVDDVNAIYTEEKAQLNELQIKFAQLQARSQKLIQVKQKIEKRKQDFVERTVRRNKAATLIQAVFRGHKTRKDIKKQQDKPKKGAKGGKGSTKSKKK